MIFKRLSLFVALAVVLAVFSIAGRAQAQGGVWSATYYPNTNFTNAIPTLYQYASLSLNFGEGPPTDSAGNPIPGMPVDNFSARFSSVQNISAGNYVFRLNVDDRATVRLNGVTIFNQTEPGTAAAQVALPGGNINIEVDYIEFTGVAFIELDWQPITPGQTGFFPTQAPPEEATETPRPTFTPLPPIPPGALTGTVVRANVLNVRNAPTTGGDRIGRVLRGQTYAVLGRDADARWFLIQLSGFQGWVNGFYLAFNRNEFTAPITSGNLLLINPPPVPDYGVRAQTQAGLRMRAAPSTHAEQTGRIDWGAFLPVIGRTANNQWWKVVWRETVGWIYAPFAVIVEGDIRNVPIE